MEGTEPQSYDALLLDIYNFGYHFLFVSSDFMMQAACLLMLFNEMAKQIYFTKKQLYK